MGKSRVEIVGMDEMRKKIKALGDRVEKINSQAARAAAEPIKDDANANAPGPYILALQSKRQSNENIAMVDIGPDKDHYYYRFIELGASGHEIKFKKARALVFTGKKGLVMTGSVSHPGMKARPFLRPAMSKNRDKSQKIAGEVFLREINRVCDD